MSYEIKNPLLPGFYPDPSIVRVGDDFYMVTSSFSFFPGVPIFHSRDLAHWEQIGHVLDRPSQLPLGADWISGGIFAPTLRFHDGVFYMITTNVDHCGNFIVTAEYPAGPWSEPHWIEGAVGIDPSLFWDDDGKAYYTGTGTGDMRHNHIWISEIDLQEFRLVGEKKDIWGGSQVLAWCPEAPHLYKKDGWYYLMVAEGGTFINHSVQMARCRTINGDYEICPRNPIISHRHMPILNPISVTGHADITDTQNGEWWMVLLAVRPYAGGHYNLGRETFMVPMVWAEDGWPMIDNETGLVNEEERLPNLPRCIYPPMPETDNFESSTLQMQWNTIHPPLDMFYSLTERPGYLRLNLRPEVMEEICTPSFVGRRQRHKEFLAKTAMEFIPSTPLEEAGIALVQDDRFHYLMTVRESNGKRVLQLWKTEKGLRTLVKETVLKTGEGDKTSRIYLSVQGHTDGYTFYYGYDEQEMLPFVSYMDGSLLSSVVNEGFTGAYIGMYASSNHTVSENHADFDWFSYQGE